METVPLMEAGVFRFLIFMPLNSMFWRESFFLWFQCHFAEWTNLHRGRALWYACGKPTTCVCGQFSQIWIPRRSLTHQP